MRLHSSARKHFTRDRLTEDDVRHAAAHAVLREALDDEDDPRRWLLLGYDRSARILELVLLEFDSGEHLVIHAMKARDQYLRAL